MKVRSTHLFQNGLFFCSAKNLRGYFSNIYCENLVVQFSSVTQLYPTFCDTWISVRQSSLFISSQSLLKFMSIALVMPSNHLIPCFPLLLPPSIFPSIRVFSNESALHIRWPKEWSFSFSISPSNEGLPMVNLRFEIKSSSGGTRCHHDNTGLEEKRKKSLLLAVLFPLAATKAINTLIFMQ